MAWCLRPSLATLSSVNDGTVGHRYLSFFANSWPADPGSYELTQQIGSGSSAAVFQAQCKELESTVAVKKVNLDGVCDLASLTREAALLRRFQHRHVLLLYTSFVVDRELWMVMPYMDLGSVRSIMRTAFPQGLDEVLIATIMRSTLQALDYVHRNGGIHRDVKADNILINSSGEVRLADFGVAADSGSGTSVMLDRLLGDSSGSTEDCTCGSSGGSSSSQEGPRIGQRDNSTAAMHHALLALRANTFVGTPCWMAPEVMQQLDEGYNNAADIWSLGITLIELATGRPPLARCHPVRVVVDTLNGPPPCLPDDYDNKRFSKAFRDLVTTCLQKDPSKRPTAAALLQHKFFRAARDAAYLSATLTAALQAAKQPRGLQAGQTGSVVGGPSRIASTPGPALSSLPFSTSMQASSGRKVQSEPFMTRLRSMLRLQIESGSFIGRNVSRFGFAAASSARNGGAGCARQKSRWQFTTAALGVGMKTRSLSSTPPAGPTRSLMSPGGLQSAVSSGGVLSEAASGPSLSQKGSRGLQPVYAAVEGAGWSPLYGR